MDGPSAGSATRIPAAWELAPVAVAPREPSSRLVDYVLLRVTGLVLSVLVIGHFVVTHIVTDVTGDNSSFVARRLSSLGWVVWDATMLAAALAHGTVGVRLAIGDYAPRSRARSLERLAIAIAVVLFAAGTVAIVRSAHV